MQPLFHFFSLTTNSGFGGGKGKEKSLQNVQKSNLKEAIRRPVVGFNCDKV